MRLDRLLQSQGFGTRSACQTLIATGRVRLGGLVCVDVERECSPHGLSFEVDGQEWRYQTHVYIVMNKPPAVECSHTPSHHPSIYSYLPAQFINRGVQAVGRLDADTTGLLLFSDDGQFIHTYTSPKKSIGKCYEVDVRHALTDDQIAALLAGVCLRDDPQPVSAIRCELVGPRRLRMTVCEGRYHLVKRMIAAVGNRVECLSRLSVGEFFLPEELEPGSWRWLDEKDLAQLGRGAVSSRAPMSVDRTP